MKRLAGKYILWRTPDEAVAIPVRVVAHVMNVGDYDGVQRPAHQEGGQYPRDVLDYAQIRHLQQKLASVEAAAARWETALVGRPFEFSTTDSTQLLEGGIWQKRKTEYFTVDDKGTSAEPYFKIWVLIKDVRVRNLHLDFRLGPRITVAGDTVTMVGRRTILSFLRSPVPCVPAPKPCENPKINVSRHSR